MKLGDEVPAIVEKVGFGSKSHAPEVGWVVSEFVWDAAFGFQWKSFLAMRWPWGS